MTAISYIEHSRIRASAAFAAVNKVTDQLCDRPYETSQAFRDLPAGTDRVTVDLVCDLTSSAAVQFEDALDQLREAARSLNRAHRRLQQAGHAVEAATRRVAS